MHPDNPARMATAEDGSGKPIAISYGGDAPDGHTTCTRCQQHYRRTATVFVGTMEECVQGPHSSVKFQNMGYVEQAMILCPTCLELLQIFFAGGSVSTVPNPAIEERTKHMANLIYHDQKPGLVYNRPFPNPMPPKSERPEPDALGRTPSPGVWADPPPSSKRYG